MNLHRGMTKENTALLVIDPVNSCAHKNCETPKLGIHFTKIRTMLPKLDQFIKDYRKQVGGLVVMTTITPWDKEHLPDNINLLYEDPSATYYSDDTTGFDEQFHTVEVEESDIIIAKNTYDAFTSQELTNQFTQKGIKHVIVTGIFTDGCVLASVVGGFSRGYNFVILQDLVETTDDPIRQELQDRLLKYTFPVMYGRTISAAGFLSEINTMK